MIANGGDYGSRNSSLAYWRTDSGHHSVGSRISSLESFVLIQRKSPYSGLLSFETCMVKALIDMSEEAVLHRQRIQQHMRRIGDHRKLIAKLKRDGKDARPARQELRVMMFGLEGMLAEHQRLTAKKA